MLFSIRCLCECHHGARQEEAASFDWLEWEFSQLKVITYVLLIVSVGVGVGDNNYLPNVI